MTETDSALTLEQEAGYRTMAEAAGLDPAELNRMIGTTQAWPGRGSRKALAPPPLAGQCGLEKGTGGPRRGP